MSRVIAVLLIDGAELKVYEDNMLRLFAANASYEIDAGESGASAMATAIDTINLGTGS